MIILIIGLPGSGKTSRAVLLKERINAIHLNADEVRSELNNDLGFDVEDRIEHARRLGALSRLLQRHTDQPIIVDFICPTAQTRVAFGHADILIWVDRIEAGRFQDTNRLWQAPVQYDMRIVAGREIEESVDDIIRRFSLFDYKAPTTLMLGRYQPWHDGHQALFEAAQQRTAQVMIAVRNTHNVDDKNPFSYEQVKAYIQPTESRIITRVPNITNVVYGRDVGYKVEKVELGPDIESISATEIRQQMFFDKQ